MANDYALNERLAFSNIDSQTRETLRSLRPLIQKEIKPALEGFYGQVRNFPETRKFFSSESHISSAADRQAKHWDIIANTLSNEATTRINGRIGVQSAAGGWGMYLWGKNIADEITPSGGVSRALPVYSYTVRGAGLGRTWGVELRKKF